MGRTLRLTFRSDGFREGRVPLTIVADKLRALQSLVFHATATVAQDRLGRSGPWANRYRDAAELAFVSSHHSDLQIEAELPELRRPWPGVEGDLGAKVIDLVFAAGKAATANGDLQALIQNREERLYLLKAFEGLCPSAAEGYQLELSNSEPGARLSLSPDARQRLRRRVVREKERTYGEEEDTIVGQLTKIHVQTAPQLIALRLGHHPEIPCFFDDSMLDQVSNLLPGSIVEVTGWPLLDAGGRIVQLDAVTDVDTVSMEPLRVTRFEHEGKRYSLKEPLVVLVEYTDGVWTYHNDEINLWGYARRRVDALKELAAAFDYLFREIAQEADDVLDSKSQLIKQRLLALVEEPARKAGEDAS